MSTLTLDTLKDFMKALSVQDNSPRKLVVQTGVQGMHMFHNAMKEESERQLLKIRRLEANSKAGRIRAAKKITHKEWQNLRGMIKSPDLENLVIVEAIIEQYEQ